MTNNSTFWILFWAVLLIMFASISIAENSGTSGNVTLRIFDDTDSVNRYSNLNVTFYANLTNSSSTSLNATVGNADCDIIYNFTGTPESFVNMDYNWVLKYWQTNRTFNYKGGHSYTVNCTSDYGNITLSDSFTILNTAPTISLDRGGTYIDIDGDDFNTDYFSCTEDILCVYNFSANVTDPDVNDNLVYGNLSSANSTLTNFTLNSSTGVLEANITYGDITGTKQIELTVQDSESPVQNGILKLNISSVNDAPVFTNLENKSFNATEAFEYVISTSDEENNTPYSFNITFLSCAIAQWSNETDCILFSESGYSFDNPAGKINISFTPTRNDVGSYIINLTVTDSGVSNSSTSQLANFTVLNINNAPYFRYVCDNERSAVEDTEFSCFINVSDIDENNNLTISVNETWFLFNSTGLSSANMSVNSTTEYNATFIVKFNASDVAVGNWSLNITLTDTANVESTNSTIINFYVSNINDSVYLATISNITAFTTNNYTVYVNATDDDILIPGKSLYNESLVFSSNTSWVDVSTYEQISGSNITSALIQFNPNDAGGSGNYSINISVHDANNYSSDYSIFIINVLGNTRPQWNESTKTNHSLIEGTEFYLNLSTNATDSEGDPLNFSFINDTLFPSFSIGGTTGVINFTPVDSDVGQHIVTINVTDGAVIDSLEFNFTVSNIGDNPSIQSPLNVLNATVDSNSNINVSEDNLTTLVLWVHDDDVRIPTLQKGFYNESLNVTVTLVGPNTNLFSFVETEDFPTDAFPQRVEFDAVFTPNKSDVGAYNITLNVTDLSYKNSSITFNLTVEETQHGPVITSVSNQSVKVNSTLSLDINSTDSEDGGDSAGILRYIYTFLNGTDFIDNDETIFNTTTGILNVTFNDTESGSYQLNITVNDSSGLKDYFTFWIDVYNPPTLNSPTTYTIYNLTENITGYIPINISHMVANNLTYTFTLENYSEYNQSYYGNGIVLNWTFTPNFTQETYGAVQNITILAYNSLFPELNVTQDIGVNITHTNYPVNFTTNISDQSITGTSLNIDLSDYFFDYDYSDVNYNETVEFTISDNSSAITSSVSDWTLTISTASTSSAVFNITAEDKNSSGDTLSSRTSNNFVVDFTVEESSSSSSGGGGGGGGSRTVLHIIVPDPVSVVRGEDIVLPIQLENDGTTSLRGIKITGTSSFSDGTEAKLLDFRFDQTEIGTLSSGAKKDLNMFISTEDTEIGFYEITINATVTSPKFSDWGKIYITIQDSENFLDRLVFTQELFADNPECLELYEYITLAENYAQEGNYVLAETNIQRAIQGCKDSISQRGVFTSPQSRFLEYDTQFFYFVVATLACFILGLAYYVYKRIKLRKGIEAYLRKL